MVEVAEALAEVLRHAKLLAAAMTPLAPEVLGRVLAEDARADADSPPFDKSLRDGYAVRAKDCAKPIAELCIVAEIAAGSMPARSIGPGECARIFTGAPMPWGADAVVMQEDTQPLGQRVQITGLKVKRKQWVFAQGAEMRAGDVVLPARTVINPATLGVLAGLGVTKASLFPEPKVSVIATGNELVEPGAPLSAGQIRNTNGPMLAAQVTRAGGHPTYLGIMRDDRESTTAAIKTALGNANIVLIAGGVSVGKFDLVPAILEEQGVAIHVRQVRMKPGKPMLFGTKDDTLVFGLPGNPVASFICFELFVRPAMRVLAGHKNVAPIATALPVAEKFAATNDRPTYHPAKLEVGDAGYAVRPLPWLGASDLRGLQPADALVALAPGEVRLAAGQSVPVVVL